MYRICLNLAKSCISSCLPKFYVLKTNICPRSEASRANMLVFIKSNFQGTTIRPIVPRHKHSIVFSVHQKNFPVAACLKTENDKNSFIKISNRYRALRCFVFSVYPLQMISIHVCINNFICQLLTSKEETF